MYTRHSHNARDGHRLETEIDLGGAQVLSIATRKGKCGNLVTWGSVMNVAEGIDRHRPLEDFSKELESTRPKRVTEAVATAQHNQALAKIDEVKLAVEMHYQQLQLAKAGKEPTHA